MKKYNYILPLLLAAPLSAQAQTLAENPIITSQYAADPAARVFGDTLYIYPSHDRDDANTFSMEDYHVYTTTDMQTFTDRGICFDALKQTPWATRFAWAPDCVERNGKYYLYYPTDQRHIGVAVADSPLGPFHDAIGKPLISINSPGVVCNRDFIDPCCFIDDDGQAYLFVGQNDVCYVKLNPDMTSYDHSGGRLDSLGRETGVYLIEGVNEFFEAVWVHKRNGKYYISYSNGSKNGRAPEIAYAMSDKPMGPYEYKGIILPPVSSGTNHHSIVEFHGQWYMFYHNSDLSLYRNPESTRSYKYRRSTCVDSLFYNADGTIQPIRPRPTSKEKLKRASQFRFLYETSPTTGGITSLKLEKPAENSDMNWVLTPDGSQYPWVTEKHAWGLTRIANKDISVKVSRHYDGSDLVETYTFTNTGKKKTRLGDVAIQTPINDNYPDSKTCVSSRANAHIWTGGNAAYICATQKGGRNPGLGLVLTRGSISRYEVTERGSDKGSSNFRGVLALCPDDVELKKSEQMVVECRIFAHRGWQDFKEQVVERGGIIAEADHYVLEKGDTAHISFRTKDNTERRNVVMDRLGDYRYIYMVRDYKRTCNFTAFHHSTTLPSVAPISSLTASRRKTRSTKPTKLSSVTTTRLTAFTTTPLAVDAIVTTREAERIGTGLMVAQYALTHPEVADRYRQSVIDNCNFVRTRLQNPDYKLYTDLSSRRQHRHYNYPWTADLYYRAYQLTGNRQYLTDAYDTLQKLFRSFGYNFYGIGFPIMFGDSLLRSVGMAAEADSLLGQFRHMGDQYIKNGTNYPRHEVAFEQSIVSPAIISLCELYLVTRDNRYLKSAQSMLLVAESFEGHQPDHRLSNIAIRHWDGMWAGKLRRWGDTMPHFWSALNGYLFHRYGQCLELDAQDNISSAARLRSEAKQLHERANEIIHGNFSLFGEDGRATCAYIYPDRIDDNPGKLADPWANDQDWVIYYYLKFK